MAQWDEATRTASQLAPLRRTFSSMMTMGGGRPKEQIPLFVVGYTGWKAADTMIAKLEANPDIAGILIIDAGLFVTNDAYGGVTVIGPVAPWGLISVLHRITTSLMGAVTEPLDYLRLLP